MILQPRDKKLLELLSRFGVLSTEQAAKLCFEKIARTTVMRRIRKLEESNLILRLGGLPNGLNAWCLTTDGATCIGKDEPCRYANRNTLVHEVTLCELRIVLERVGVGTDWTSEMEMRRRMQWRPSVRKRNPLVPDGLFVEYSSKNAMSLVWYIVATPAIGKTIMQQWCRTPRFESSPTLIMALLNEVLRDPTTARVFTPGQAQGLLHHWIDLKPLLTSGEGDSPRSAQEVSRQDGSEVSTPAVFNSESSQRLATAPDYRHQRQRGSGGSII